MIIPIIQPNGMINVIPFFDAVTTHHSEENKVKVENKEEDEILQINSITESRIDLLCNQESTPDITINYSLKDDGDYKPSGRIDIIAESKLTNSNIRVATAIMKNDDWIVQNIKNVIDLLKFKLK